MDTSNPEYVLGKRIVNYLKNEALVGRIGKQKIQVLPKHYMTKQTIVVINVISYYPYVWKPNYVKILVFFQKGAKS